MIEKHMRWILLNTLLKWKNQYYVIENNNAFLIEDMDIDTINTIKKIKKRYRILNVYSILNFFMIMGFICLSAVFNIEFTIITFILLDFLAYGSIISLYLLVRHFFKKRNRIILNLLKNKKKIPNKSITIIEILKHRPSKIGLWITIIVLLLLSLYAPIDRGMHMSTIFIQMACFCSASTLSLFMIK